MTKRERRYHHRKDLHRRLRWYITTYGLHRLIEASMPVPKYPLGTLPVSFAGGRPVADILQEGKGKPISGHKWEMEL